LGYENGMGAPIPARDALARFVASTAEALGLVGDVSNLEWRARPAGEPWSLAQTIEHLVATNRATLGRLRAPSGGGAPTALSDDAITVTMFDGVPPPPGVPEPTGRWSERDDGIGALTAVRDAITAEVEAAGDGLRAIVAPHPVFGVFDGVQWVLFAAAHTDNHLPQLRRLTS